ncbi:acyl carrier protein [Buchnera aphidicola]|uniref:acyl carrier protein n=1 Tax=Buchnera aphidicola TaxID=9 RepID=UPI003463DFE1
MNEIEQKIKKIIAKQLGIKQKKIKNTDSYIHDLDADSLDIVELVMSFEQEFNIEISDEDAEKIDTINNTINYIYNRIKK